MTQWRPTELAAIGTVGEIEITPLDEGNPSRAATPIWIVRHDNLYIRSYRGAARRWYRAARRSGHARIRAAGIERDLTLTPHDGDRAAIDDAYRGKYGQSVDAKVADAAAATTLKLAPH